MRIVKKPEIRRQEIMDCAQKLFFELGYENTSVNLIIQKLNISKGAFYHYFKSKQELLDAISERFVSKTLESVSLIVEDPGLDAVQKLNNWFKTVSMIKSDQVDLMLVFAQVLYNEKNFLVRENLKKNWVKMITPYLDKVIKQGCNEGLFKVKFPAETAELIIRCGLTLHDSLIGKFDQIVAKKDPAPFIRLVEMYEHVFERILGLEQGTLTVTNNELLEKLVKK